MTNNDIQVCRKQGEPTAEYLTSQVPGHRFVIVPLFFSDIEAAVEKGNIDFIITDSASYELAELVTIAMLNMPDDSPAAKAANCAGWTIPMNYQLVHDCLRELRLPPYENIEIITAGEAARQYWLWLVGFMVFLGIAGLTVNHVTKLNRKLHVVLNEKDQELEAHKQIEAKLREMKVIMEQSPTMIVITDREGRIEYVNPRFTQVTGYWRDEAIGLNPRVLKSGRTSAAEYQHLWQTILSGHEWHGEFYNRKKTGEYYWESAVIAPVMNSKGVITHFIAVKEDITDRKRVEEQLVLNERRLTSLQRISQYKAETTQTLLDYALDEAIVLTQSKTARKAHCVHFAIK